MKTVHKHIRIKTGENNHVHFDREINSYTLCGLDTVGDISIGIHPPVLVKNRVDCPDCINIVLFCDKIKKSELKLKT